MNSTNPGMKRSFAGLATVAVLVTGCGSTHHHHVVHVVHHTVTPKRVVVHSSKPSKKPSVISKIKKKVSLHKKTH